MAEPRCTGDHRFFVADRAMIPSDGRVVILMACLQCGKLIKHDEEVAKPGVSFSRIENEKENTQ